MILIQMVFLWIQSRRGLPV